MCASLAKKRKIKKKKKKKGKERKEGRKCSRSVYKMSQMKENSAE